MIPKLATIALALPLSLLGACSASSSDSKTAAATNTASTTANTALKSAWAKAKAGENPANDCAKVKGSLIIDESPAAHAAMAQCNFDIPVAYFNALLDDVDAGKRTCNQFMTTMATQLSALTMSVGGLKRAVQTQSTGSADAAGAVTDALTSDSAASAKDKVKAALSQRAVTTCPVMKMYMES